MSTGRECANHPGLTAEVVCGICGKPVCGQCTVDFEGWKLCDNVQHKALLSHWSVLFVSDSEFETDIIKKNLELRGFATRIFASREYKEDIAESKGEFATLFVLQSEFKTAESVLKELDLYHGVQETSNH